MKKLTTNMIIMSIVPMRSKSTLYNTPFISPSLISLMSPMVRDINFSIRGTDSRQ